MIMRLMKYFVVNNSVGPNNHKQLNSHGKFSIEFNCFRNFKDRTNLQTQQLI